MDDHIYKQIELTGSSRNTIEDAVQNAISKAGKTLPIFTGSKWSIRAVHRRQ